MNGPLFRSAALQPLEQLNLSGVIQIVCRNAANKMAFGVTAIGKRLCQRGFRNGTDDVSQEFVFVDKQLHIFLPSPVVRWPDEPVGAFYRKSLALSRQASPRNVFPISGVNRKF